MTTLTAQHAAVAVGLLLVSACRRDGGSTPADTDTNADTDTGTDADADADADDSGGDAEVTYHGRVRGLIAQHCLDCHTEGGVGPFSLTNWDEVEPLAPLIVGAVASGSMPPWGQDETCRPTVDTMALSPEQRDTFAAWRDGGFAVGDPDEFVAPEPVDPPVATPPDLSLVPSAPYTVSAERPDDYRCLPLPHEFSRDTFVREVSVVPDRTELVHHAIVFAVPAAARESLQALDAQDDAPGWDCFGDVGVQAATTLGGWVPGTTGGPLPPGMAQRIAAGSQLVVQMHYSSAGRAAEDLIAPDRSAVALWTMAEGETPEQLMISVDLANLGIEIAAGDPESAHELTTRVPVSGLILGSSPHMHLLGRSLQTSVVSGGEDTCVTDVQRWDFNWQRDYFFEDPIAIDIHDQVAVRCVYDNSPENQPVVDGTMRQPQDVTWGESTFDEMCLESLVIAVDYEGDGSGGVCDGASDCAAACAQDDVWCTTACYGNQGDACLDCGLEALLLGDCTTNNCEAEQYDALVCLDGCDESNFFGCAYDQCGASMTALHQCWAPLQQDQACAADSIACEG